MSMGIPLDDVGKGGLGEVESRAIGEGQSIKRGVNQGRVECIGAKVVDWSVD